MNLSKTKILLFFVALGVLGWFLYPRGPFLAYMYEGLKDLSRAERSYLSYLKDHPGDRDVTLRLAQLYGRMAEPEKATPLLKALYESRKRDWKIAQVYLTHLEDMNDLELLFDARRQVARNFMTVPHFPADRILFLLESSLHYALWKQKYEDAYEILDEIESVAKKPDYYGEVREKIDRGLKKLPNVLSSLEARLAKNPRDLAVRRDLVNIHIALKDFAKAKALADETLALFPKEMYVLQSRIFALTKLGETDAAIRDIERLLGFDSLNRRERDVFTADLGFLYKDKGDYAKAISAFEELRERDPSDADRWLNILGVHLDRKDWRQASALLNEYLTAFPQDADNRKLLVDIHLYELKDTEALPLYAAYLDTDGDARFAGDVSSLLVERHKKTEAEAWLKGALGRYPADEDMTGALLGLYFERKDDVMAENLLDGFVARRPDHVPMTVTLAQLKSKRGDVKSAEALYDEVLARKSDFETLKSVGKEFFFMGLVERAEEQLRRARELRPEDPEVAFWLSEIAYFRGDRKAGAEFARTAIQAYSAKTKLTAEERRQLLRARSRLGYDWRLAQDYLAAIASSPRDVDLHADFIDAQLEYKKTWEAQQELKHFRAKFPQALDRARPLELRLALLKRDWTGAIALLEGMIKENSGLWSYRRDLAEAYVQAGEWKKGIREYEAVHRATGDQYRIRRRLNDLHDEYDKKVTAGFRWIKLGSERIYEGIAGTGAYFHRDWEFNADVRLGDFDAAVFGLTDQAVLGEAGVLFHGLKRWTFRAGAGFGASDLRKTGFPVAGIRFMPGEDVSFEVGGTFRKLRFDVPQAVVRGALFDEAHFRTRATLLDRIELGGRYEFTRTYLPEGQSSLGHRVEPSAALIVLRDPYLTFGYQYVFSDQSDENGFLGQVQLIPRTSAHYLTAYVSKTLANRVDLEANAFLGGDTARDLDFFAGDLFGFGSKIRFRATRHLNVDAQYEFGRETRTTVTGDYHNLGVFLTGHWF